MATRKRELRPDAEGRYRPEIGWFQEIDVDVSVSPQQGVSGGDVRRGKRRQPRFNLGTDQKEAERRVARIRELYEDNCRLTKSDLWSPQALSFAKEIARGEKRIVYPAFSDVIDQDDPLLEYAQMHHNIMEMYPSVQFEADPQLYSESLKLNREYVGGHLDALQGKLKQEGALPPKTELPREFIPGLLHEALDAYEEDIRRHNVVPGSSELKSYGLRRLERVKRFKEHHADIALYSLTFDTCKAMLDYWRTRPARHNGKPTSRSNSRHHLGELMRFFRWLDTSSSFRWLMPRGLERVDRKIPKTDGERKLSSSTKDIYTIEELAVLNAHATPFDRLTLYVGLNCAMGAAELGRLTSIDLLLGQAHDHAKKLYFDSTEADSFLRFLRPKTGVFGEWLLWEETVEMFRWGIERAAALKSDLLFVSEQGKPLYRENTKNPHSNFSNAWTDLIKRVRKSEPGFRYLPFGTLRDTLPDTLRHRHGDEIATLSLAHGSPFAGDSLLECYGNKPFGRLHKALRELRSYFAPVFAAAPRNPCEERKHYLPIATHWKIEALIAEGNGARQIAQECAVSLATVYRIIAQTRTPGVEAVGVGASGNQEPTD